MKQLLAIVVALLLASCSDSTTNERENPHDL